MNKILSFLLISFVTFCEPLSAQFGPSEYVEAELISEMESVQPGSTVWVGLQFKLKDHWHTYWRNPGDSGLATDIEWDLPEGVEAGEIVWPIPEQVVVAGFLGYVYEHEVLHLIPLKIGENIKPDSILELKGTANWLECDPEQCIPGSAEVTLSIPIKQEQPAVKASLRKLFSETRKQLAARDSSWSIQSSVTDNTLEIIGEHSTALPPSELHFYINRTGFVSHGSAQPYSTEGNRFTLSVPLDPASGASVEELAAVGGMLVAEQPWLGDAGRALKVNLASLTENATPVPPSKASKIGLPFALGLAFLGGMILNLMPCVFPVLSIKVMGFVDQAQGDQKHAAIHGWIFTLGVLVSFWILAGVLLGLRAGGEQVGWGFQMQNPKFLMFMIGLFYIFGLSLFGVFEIGTSLTGAGGNVTGKSGWTGSFFSGVLATIVATPCTAPLMAPALGFAAAAPASTAMLIFTALGFGMALPYLLLSNFLSLLKFVPRPGPWMESMKQFMGFLMMATVIWLLWVLGAFVGNDGLLKVMLGLLIVGIACWVYGRWGAISRPGSTRLTAALVGLVLLVGGSAYALKSLEVKTSNWQPWSPERVAALRAEGTPVFVDFTAAWCISCQANKKAALHREKVLNRFQELGVTTLIADFTKQDPVMGKAINEFGRDGVPVYVLYGKDQAEPILLPSLLTPDIVFNALDKI